MTIDLGLIDGQQWGAAHLDAIEAAINLGVLVCTAATRPAGVVGRTVWETDTKRLWTCTAAGTPGTWILLAGALPHCRLYSSTVQSIPHNTATAITWDLEVWDTDAMHSTSVNTSRITIPAGLGGRWAFQFQVTVPASVAGTVGAYLRVNGSGDIWTDMGRTNQAGISSTDTVQLSGAGATQIGAGDYVDVVAIHTNGSSAARNYKSGSYQAVFAAQYLGPV